MYFKSNFYSIYNLFLISSISVCLFDSSTMNHYGYLELCDFDQCYSFFMNVTYDNETRNALFSCSSPVPLDEGETLPHAYVELSPPFPYGNNRSICNESLLLMENVKSDMTRSVNVYITDINTFDYSIRPRVHFYLGFDKSAGIIVDGNKSYYNESQWNCSLIDKSTHQRACFCATNAYAKIFCANNKLQQFHPEFYMNGDQYYHFFGNWTTDGLYEYYFKMDTTNHTILASFLCRSASLFFNGENQTNIHFAFGTNSTLSRPEEMDFIHPTWEIKY
ncbi:hypothetical protein DdX_14736 [Ditylenchus destructor]|uniref:Uncharacterized protein n=1 Tax=Ditylenchus destructor TaxID=166010 RepID=A0AAD4QYB7_9BILA|nr:hypothetical protein DdX_14736 [Ditylenchus destructor]